MRPIGTAGGMGRAVRLRPRYRSRDVADGGGLLGCSWPGQVEGGSSAGAWRQCDDREAGDGLGGAEGAREIVGDQQRGQGLSGHGDGEPAASAEQVADVGGRGQGPGVPGGRVRVDGDGQLVAVQGSAEPEDVRGEVSVGWAEAERDELIQGRVAPSSGGAALEEQLCADGSRMVTGKSRMLG